MLEVADVSVERGGIRILTGLTLTLRPGRPFWIVGPNGSGKTSLIRVLAGLDAPVRGEIRRSAPPGAPFLYFHSEMALPSAATVGDWDRLARSLLDGGPGTRTVLWPDVDGGRKAGRLSTGERKRLLLDVLFRRPGSLLLDEPFEHLSPDAKSDLDRLIQARARTDVVVVATNQATARSERDGGLRLEGGVATHVTARDPGGTP